VLHANTHGVAFLNYSVLRAIAAVSGLACSILIGLYTRTRAGAIATASLCAEQGRSFVDLERSIFYRTAIGKRATKKRQTPAPIPPRLLAHMRRLERAKADRNLLVEFNGKPVASVKKGFRRAVGLAGLPGRVTPHTLRHTAATWLMQRGVPIWGTAGFLGVSPEVLQGRMAITTLISCRALQRQLCRKAGPFRWLTRALPPIRTKNLMKSGRSGRI
jgi:integrase